MTTETGKPWTLTTCYRYSHDLLRAQRRQRLLTLLLSAGDLLR
jgi:hypothetical protein